MTTSDGATRRKFLKEGAAAAVVEARDVDWAVELESVGIVLEGGARRAVAGGTGGRTPTTIVETSRASWAESNLASLSTGVSLDAEAGDRAGPLSVAVAVSGAADAGAENQEATSASDEPKPETRLVVFGDSDFATNAYAGVPGNPNLFANAVNWLAQQENLIAIRPRESEDRRVTMTPRQQTMAFFTSILFIPALVFAAGVYTWWRRR